MIKENTENIYEFLNHGKGSFVEHKTSNSHQILILCNA